MINTPLSHRIWIACLAIFRYEILETDFYIGSKFRQGSVEIEFCLDGKDVFYKRDIEKEAMR